MNISGLPLRPTGGDPKAGFQCTLSNDPITVRNNRFNSVERYDGPPLFVTERIDSYRYSESLGPWWVDRQRNRKVTSALPFFRSMTSVLEVKSTNLRGVKRFWGSLSVQVQHKESRIVPVVAPWISSRKSRVFLFPVTERLTDFV